MNFWAFQGNPDMFDVTGYVAGVDRIVWSVRQRHFAPRMKPGDEVFLWRSAGAKKEIAGVIAVATILDEPTERPDEAASLGFWGNPADASKSELRVRLRIDRKCMGAKEVVKGEWMHEENPTPQ